MAKLYEVSDLGISRKEIGNYETMMKLAREKWGSSVELVCMVGSKAVPLTSLVPTGGSRMVYRMVDDTWDSPWITMNDRELRFRIPGPQ